MSIAEVIGWKFNQQSGMSTRDGIITEFPGGLPSQSDQDIWTAEYDAWLIANPPTELITADDLFETLVGLGILSTSDRPTRP